MPEPSSTMAAHQEVLARLRGDIDLALGYCERNLVPALLPHTLMDAMRECDRLEGIAKDFEDELDRLAESLREAGDELMARD